MKRLTVTIAALVWLAGTGIADARPCPRPRPSTEQAGRSRTSCERYARVVADGTGAKRGSREWRRAYDAAYSQCIANPMVVAA